MRRIKITVDPAGKTTIVTSGFTGKSCKDASRLLEEALGRVKSDELTAELYEEHTQDVQVDQST
jgi:hypothetical protein